MATEAYKLLQEFSERLTYKPNHYFGVDKIDEQRARIFLGCKFLPDSTGKHTTVGITIHDSVDLNGIRTKSDVLQAYVALVAKFELHEAAEFLRVDGNIVFLPHRPGAEQGGFTWLDFINLGGRYLRAVKKEIDHVSEQASPADNKF